MLGRAAPFRGLSAGENPRERRLTLAPKWSEWWVLGPRAAPFRDLRAGRIRGSGFPPCAQMGVQSSTAVNPVRVIDQRNPSRRYSGHLNRSATVRRTRNGSVRGSSLGTCVRQGSGAWRRPRFSFTRTRALHRPARRLFPRSGRVVGLEPHLLRVSEVGESDVPLRGMPRKPIGEVLLPGLTAIILPLGVRARIRFRGSRPRRSPKRAAPAGWGSESENP